MFGLLLQFVVDEHEESGVAMHQDCLSRFGEVPLRLECVTRDFGRGRGVFDISMEVCRGEILGIAGNNGAGKTTLLNLISGLERLDSGRIIFRGREILNGDSWARQYFGCVSAGSAFYPELSVRQNLGLFARLKGISDANSINHILHLVGMIHAADIPVKRCSSGMIQRLSLARGLIGMPPLLLLDEPSNNLDFAASAEFWLLLRNYALAGASVVLSSHMLDDLERVADRVLVIHKGRGIICGAVDAIMPKKVHYSIKLVTDAVRCVEFLRVMRPELPVSSQGPTRFTLTSTTEEMPSLLKMISQHDFEVTAVYPSVPALHAILLSAEGNVHVDPDLPSASPSDGAVLPSKTYPVSRTWMRNLGRLLRAEVTKQRKRPAFLVTLTITVAVTLLIARRMGYLPGDQPTVGAYFFLAVVAQFALLTIGATIVSGMACASLSGELSGGTVFEVLRLPYSFRQIVTAKILVNVAVYQILLAGNTALAIALVWWSPETFSSYHALHTFGFSSSLPVQLIMALLLTAVTYACAVLLGLCVGVIFRRMRSAPIISVGAYLLLDIGKEFSSHRHLFPSASAEDSWRRLGELADNIVGADVTAWQDFYVPCACIAILSCVLLLFSGRRLPRDV